MKTSFYFVLWILIYPILGLFENSFINNNSFIVALAAVWGLSWLLNRIMPETLTFERASQITPILEDIYTGNVTSFEKRLSREANIEVLTAIYLIVTTVVIAIAIFKAGVNDWIALAIFGFFTIGAISRSAGLVKAKSQLNDNPTPEQCMDIAAETYQLDYASYYEVRSNVPYSEMLPPRPRFYKAFGIFSLVVATIAALLGILYIVLGIMIMVSQSSLETGVLAGMYFLYGSLAAYFGVKDLISIIHSKSNNTSSGTLKS